MSFQLELGRLVWVRQDLADSHEVRDTWLRMHICGQTKDYWLIGHEGYGPKNALYKVNKQTLMGLPNRWGKAFDGFCFTETELEDKLNNREPAVITAKYPGTCAGCGDNIAQGQQIVWYGKGEAYHEDCRPLASRIPAKQEPLKQSGYLFIDLETGGLNEQIHPMLQIAAIATTNSLVIRDTFDSLLSPAEGVENIDPGALATNHLTVEQLLKAPPESSVMEDFLAFCHQFPDHRFAGFNCPFDLKFLDQRIKKHRRHTGPEPLYLLPPLDLYKESKGHESCKGLPTYKLVAVAEHLQIKTAGAHDALVDLYMTIQVARALRLGG